MKMKGKKKLNKGYGFLRRKECFGQIPIHSITSCDKCSKEERLDCYVETLKRVYHEPE